MNSRLNTRCLSVAVIIACLFGLASFAHGTRAYCATWDDYGCRPDDEKFDNGPPLSRMIAALGGEIDVTPVGRSGRSYYVSTPIIWPPKIGGALVGSGGSSYVVGKARPKAATLIVWNGPPGKPMLIYGGYGGRIEQIVFQGAVLHKHDNPAVAGIGILCEARDRPPSGKLHTDQVAILKCDIGIKCANEPNEDHADAMVHYDLTFGGCRINYQVDCQSSVEHRFYTVRSGHCERYFDFRRGGDLRVWGCYQGQCIDSTLLALTDNRRNSWPFVIEGLRVDPGTKNFRFLESQNRTNGRVRIEGSVPASVGIAAEPVVIKDAGADIRIDTTHFQWPRRRSP